MAKFSKTSSDRLSQAHEDQQTLFNEVIKYVDCTIVCTHRGEVKQNKAYDDGFSKVRYPNSKHNQLPSLAVDCVPWPSLYSDRDKMIEFSGFVMGIYNMLKKDGKITSDIASGFQLWGWDECHFQIKS